jgi:O-antigen/teichoic acid export membrane protein
MHTLKFRRAELFRNVAVLVAGKTLAAAVAFLTIPIIARLLTPSDYGTAAVFTSMVGMLSSVASLRYGTAIILPKSEPTTIRLRGLSHRIAIAYCAVVLIALLAFNICNVTWTALDLLGIWKWSIPFDVLLTASVGLQESRRV